MGDAAYVRNRWLADPEAAFAAEAAGEIIGSNFATNWGSVGFFGPLTIRPDFWDRKKRFTYSFFQIALWNCEMSAKVCENLTTIHEDLIGIPIDHSTGYPILCEICLIPCQLRQN